MTTLTSADNIQDAGRVYSGSDRLAPPSSDSSLSGSFLVTSYSGFFLKEIFSTRETEETPSSVMLGEDAAADSALCR